MTKVFKSYACWHGFFLEETLTMVLACEIVFGHLAWVLAKKGCGSTFKWWLLFLSSESWISWSKWINGCGWNDWLVPEATWKKQHWVWTNSSVLLGEPLLFCTAWWPIGSAIKNREHLAEAPFVTTVRSKIYSIYCENYAKRKNCQRQIGKTLWTWFCSIISAVLKSHWMRILWLRTRRFRWQSAIDATKDSLCAFGGHRNADLLLSEWDLLVKCSNVFH